MKRDTRDPERFGKAILGLKSVYPKATICERADMMEQWYQDLDQEYAKGQANFWQRTFSTNGTETAVV